MKKICVFCGNKPENKNKEHVLPQWLLEMTGDPNRTVKFGYNFKSEKEIEFNWKSFTAPSCTKCNDRYAEFEGKIKEIVKKLQNKIELTGKEILELLDWLDKVRIGLWINYYYLEQNKGQINPRLCIDNRLAKKDRFMQIHFLESKHKSDGLNAFGVESFVFQFNPSFFGLRINNILITNGSNDFLISKNCGFPYPNKIETVENGMLSLSEWKYDRKTYHEIDNLNLHKGVLTIMQPIQTELAYESNFFNDSYLIQNCISRDNRIGTIFRIKDEKLMPINDLNKKIEFESVMGDDVKLIGNLISKIYEGQNVFLKRVIKEIETFKMAIELNEKIIEYHKSNK
jgi:hypothetical protein